MAKFEYEYNGYIYEIEADDEKSADAKFNKTIADYPTPENQEKTKKEQTQNKQWDDKIKSADTPWKKTDAYLGAIFGRANRTLRNAVPGLDTMEKKINPSLIKGIPVAGGLVPQTDELSQFEKEHPYMSKGLQIAGGTAATMPIMGGASKVMGPGFWKQFMGQFGASAPMNVADTYVKKGGDVSQNDVAKDLLWAAGSSAIPAGLTSLIGQSARYSSKHPAQEIADFMKVGGSKFPSGANKPPPGSMSQTTPAISSAIPGGISQRNLEAGAALAGGAIGSGHSIEGALLGALLGPSAYRLGAEPSLRALQHPSTQDILRSLAAQSHSQMQPNVSP